MNVETLFINKLKPLLDAIAKDHQLFVPVENQENYCYAKYNPEAGAEQLNNIRLCAPVKEFLFPMRELAAVFPEPETPAEVEPFAVFGLKDCDLKSIEVLDCVFDEDDFKDPSYIQRRDKMFIISTDCWSPEKSCFCNVMGGDVYPKSGFDLNLSKIADGYIVEIGSDKGMAFMKANEGIFAEAPTAAIAQRDENRKSARKKLDEINAEYKLDGSIRQIVEDGQESEIYDGEAQDCVECQACTRVCPTCHCFYLYDTSREDYFGKMKMWDSCVRRDYAAVAGGENPRKILADRAKHRLLHKFVYFLDRYGIQMCVGCGRCVDGCAGGMELRDVLKKLNEECKNKK